MKTATIARIEDFHALVGQEVAVSDWVTIDQDRIDHFADATGDPQWIHVDVERAKAESPFGSTIAHGFLTVSLLALLFESVVELPPEGMGVNYGLNKVRFTHPVRAGERVRGRFTLVSASDLEPGVHLEWAVIVEIENRDKPACVIEWLTRRYP
ncbi:MaoC family dehydratase [Tepidamorphus sp. 3E244]|uniref:MaoC family dehydratase n=1 Tax=Tepidamorphus sp. 3E244 TaxID=3385498 RepID=UPI0038FD354C